MRLLLIILLWASTKLFAQDLITATIVDFEDNPIIGAIIKCDHSNKYATSGIDGKFELYIDTIDESVDIQCLSYVKCNIPVSKIQETNIIRLETLPILLGAVEITPTKANELLDKAFKNTQEKLLLNQDINYLLHFTQSIDKENLTDELYLKYSSNLQKTKARRGYIPYKLNLIALQHIRNETNNSELQIVPGNYHESSFLNKPKLDKYTCKLGTSENDSLLVIEIIANEKSKTNQNALFYINKSDTTITCFTSKHIDNITNEDAYSKYKDIKYAQDGNVYCEYKPKGESLYLSKFNWVVSLHCKTKEDEYDSSFLIDLKALHINDNGIENKTSIKLNGYSGELFKIPDTNISEFTE